MLARDAPGEMVMVSEIAAEQNAPSKFLDLILLDLRKQGIAVQPARADGRLHLARPIEFDHLRPGHPHDRWAARASAVRERHRLLPLH